MKRKTRVQRLVIGMFALAVLAALSLNGVFAWTKHQVSVKNELKSQTVEVKVDEPVFERDDDTLKKEVQFKNTGSAPVFLRVSYTETLEIESQWQALAGTELVKNWTQAWANQWVDGGDGWYYYKSVLKPNATTDKILTSVSLAPYITDLEDNGAGPAYEYSLNFIVEAVQASDEVAVNTAATQAAFGKTGTISSMVVDATTGSVTSGTVSWS